MQRLWAFVLAAVAVASAAQANLTDAQLCQAHLSARAWNAALVSCSNAIDSGAYEDEALGLLYATRADALAAKTDLEAAIADYGRAIELNPKAAAPRFARGGLHLRRGNADAAITDFREVVRMRPNNVFALFGLGSAYAQAKDWRSAIAPLTDAIERKPDYGVAYRLRAEVYKALGNSAMADADKAAAKRLGVKELSRTTPVALPDEPKPIIEVPPEARASANAPVDTFVLEALAECARANANKDWDQAVATCTRAIDSRQLTGTRLAGAHADRAIAHDEAMRPEQAMADYDMALKLSPGNAVFLANRAVSLAKDGHVDRAMADFQAAITRKPAFGYAYAMRGLTHLAAGNTALAKADMRKAYDLGERHPVLVEKMQALGLQTP